MKAPHFSRRSLAIADALVWPALALGVVYNSMGPVAFGFPLLLIGLWTLFRLHAAIENRCMSFRVAFPVLGVWLMPGQEIGGGPYRFTTLRVLWWLVAGTIIYALWGIAYLFLGP